MAYKEKRVKIVGFTKLWNLKKSNGSGHMAWHYFLADQN